MRTLSKKWVVVLLGITLFLTASGSMAGAALSQQPENLAKTLKKVMPAVVHIAVRTKINPALAELAKTEEQRQALAHKIHSFGSGVILDAEQGYIVTNAHVTKDADEITVLLSDGRHFKGKLLGTDAASDIAVIKINGSGLISMAVGDSDQLRVGDFVAAIGSPYGLSQTVTSGIVSAMQRSNLGIEGYEEFIQTDAAINLGNSGGALVDGQGRLIGINTAILSSNGSRGGSIGIGFAIPINMVNSVMQQLIKYGKLRRGLLGLLVQDLSPQLAEVFGNPKQKGGIVTQVVPNSPAAKAGVKVGDIITEINGKKIIHNAQVRNTTGLLRIGEEVNLTILRNGKHRQFQMKIVDPKNYEAETAKQLPFLSGLVLDNFEQLAPNGQITRGARVLLVEEDSPGQQAIPSLQPGDVIISANDQKVNSIQDLFNATDLSKKQLLLNVLRGNNALFIVVTPKIT